MAKSHGMLEKPCKISGSLALIQAMLRAMLWHMKTAISDLQPFHERNFEVKLRVTNNTKKRRYAMADVPLRLEGAMKTKNVKALKDGAYEVSIMVAGKRYYKRLPRPSEKLSTRQLEKWLESERATFESKITGNYKTPLKFAELLLMWVEAADVRDSTKKTYKSQFPRLLEYFGGKRVDRITEYDIKMYTKTLTAGIIENNLSIISNVCKLAKSLGMIAANPIDNVKAPHRNNAEKEIYTRGEIAFLLNSMEAHDNAQFRLFVVLAVNSGMRTAEMLGLAWDSVDIYHATIRIHQQLCVSEDNKLYIYPATKNGKERTIKIPKSIVKILSDWKNQSDNEMVFFDKRNGGYLPTTHPRNWLMAHCKKIGLLYCSPHSFRHFYATCLINDGVAPAIVAKTIGDELSAVYRNYVHAESGAEDIASAAIERALSCPANQREWRGQTIKNLDLT
jgi:integrase